VYNNFRLSSSTLMFEKVASHLMAHQTHTHDSLLTGARQTMAAWSKVLESREDIPVVFRNSFDRQFHVERQFPHVIFTPSLEKFPRKTTEKLICDTEDVIYIFERNGNQIQETFYSFQDVSLLELGIVLLDSWLTISGKTKQGEPGISKIEFNTTSLRFFTGILTRLRPSSQTMDGAQFAFEKDKFNQLARANFKFMNYGRESLVPGESVLQILLQPEIRQSLFTIFGRTFYKTLSPAHLSILTDKELIFIQDPEHVKESKIARYGGIWKYLSLRGIEAVTISEITENRLLLTIQCQQGTKIEKLFEASNRSQLEQFRSNFQALH
jgi:hypothetical protein